MIKMRIPTTTEWDKLVLVTGGDNSQIHVDGIASWVDDKERIDPLKPLQAYRGPYAASGWVGASPIHRDVDIGFRPAVELDSVPGYLIPKDLKEGDKFVIGTLHMCGRPVEVPWDPSPKGNVTDYVPMSSLDIRNPLDDQKYQMKAIYIGDGVAIVDRVMLKNISYLDIELQVNRVPATNAHVSDLIKLLQNIMDTIGGDLKLTFESEEWTDNLEELKFQERSLNSVTVENGCVCISLER